MPEATIADDSAALSELEADDNSSVQEATGEQQELDLHLPPSLQSAQDQMAHSSNRVSTQNMPPIRRASFGLHFQSVSQFPNTLLVDELDFAYASSVSLRDLSSRNVDHYSNTSVVDRDIFASQRQRNSVVNNSIDSSLSIPRLSPNARIISNFASAIRNGTLVPNHSFYSVSAEDVSQRAISVSFNEERRLSREQVINSGNLASWRRVQGGSGSRHSSLLNLHFENVRTRRHSDSDLMHGGYTAHVIVDGMSRDQMYRRSDPQSIHSEVRTIGLELDHQEGLLDHLGPNNSNPYYFQVAVSIPNDHQMMQASDWVTPHISNSNSYEQHSPISISSSDDKFSTMLSAASDEDLFCSICWVELDVSHHLPHVSDTAVCVTPCQHVYHHGCLQTWLREKRVCPMCREQCTMRACCVVLQTESVIKQHTE